MSMENSSVVIKIMCIGVATLIVTLSGCVMRSGFHLPEPRNTLDAVGELVHDPDDDITEFGSIFRLSRKKKENAFFSEIGYAVGVVQFVDEEATPSNQELILPYLGFHLKKSFDIGRFKIAGVVDVGGVYFLRPSIVASYSLGRFQPFGSIGAAIMMFPFFPEAEYFQAVGGAIDLNERWRLISAIGVHQPDGLFWFKERVLSVSVQYNFSSQNE
jgi:hypothetical protein